MYIQNYPILYSDHPLIIRMVVDDTGYWAVDEAFNWIHNDKVICSFSDVIQFHKYSWIHLYKFDDNHFILLDGDDRLGTNLWIINKKGQIIRGFSVGDSPIKIHAQNRKIIVAYSETQAIDSGIALAIFDEFGKCLRTYDKEVSWEVQGICRKNTNEVIFHSYDRWEVSVLNLETLGIHQYKSNKTAEDYYSAFITYSPTTQYIYTGTRDDFKEGRDDINSVHMNVLRGKLKRKSNEILFEPFAKINLFCYHMSLNNGRVAEIDFNQKWTKTKQANYSIIDFEK